MPLPTSPAILLTFACIGLMLGRALHISSGRFWRIYGFVAMLLTSGAMAVETFQAATSRTVKVGATSWIEDPLARAELWVIILFGTLTAIGLRRVDKTVRDITGYVLFALAGLMLVASANDFVGLGLSLEIVSLAVIGISQSRLATGGRRVPWQRSAMTYAAVLSGCLWLGVAIVGNSVASTHFDQIRAVLTDVYDPGTNREAAGTPSKLLLSGAGLIVVSLLGRMGLVPFQFRMTSMASNRPVWIAGLIIQTELLAGSIGLARLMGTVFVAVGPSLLPLIMVCSLATLAWICLMSAHGFSAGVKAIPIWLVCFALLEASLMGPILMTLAIELDHPGLRWGAFLPGCETLAVLVYMQISFVLAFTAVCLMLALFSRGDRDAEFVEDLKGMGRVAPVSASMFVVALASMIGCPLTAGFWGRGLMLLTAANVHLKWTSNIYTPQSGLRFLLLVCVLTVACLARVVIAITREMFLEAQFARPVLNPDRGLFVASVVATLGIAALGVAPQAALIPLRSIPAPREVYPTAPQRGSGRNSLGFLKRNDDVRIKPLMANPPQSSSSSSNSSSFSSAIE